MIFPVYYVNGNYQVKIKKDGTKVRTCFEEHFKAKSEVSGTAKRIAGVLDLNPKTHINSIRVGGIVGRHEIIFGLPNQTIRLSHESISRAAFGQGAIFAAKAILGKPPGMYTMENIIAKMFEQNIPVY